ncbi:hypothetical protein K0U91_04905 [Chryseobacterium chendengshani]|nr:hypothetical protein [Chryseobacterium sp. LJ668]QYK17466.1 hypothetical protein K0U91_04905 [Chryseobacterium sp. LJ668]
MIDIEKDGWGQPAGYYRKDINNVLDQFQGTYIYTNGNTTLKMILVKKIKQYNGSYYEDLIIGEYQYIVNGLVKINTLSNINVVYNNQYVEHAIAGISVINNNNRQWKCPQCIPDEKRLHSRIIDRSSNRYADFFMRKTVVNGQEVMQVKIANVKLDVFNDNPQPFSLPLGEFTMIKQ